MSKEFETSVMGQSIFLLGLKIKKDKKGVLISKSMYALELVKKFGMGKTKDSSKTKDSLDATFAELTSSTSITISDMLNPHPCPLLTKQIIFIPDYISNKAIAINEAMNSMKRSSYIRLPQGFSLIL